MKMPYTMHCTIDTEAKGRRHHHKLLSLHRSYQMVESATNCSVSLTAAFSFPEGISSEVEQKFDASNCQPARLGLPVGDEAVKVSKMFVTPR